MFQLSEKEVAELNRSQIVIGSEKHHAELSRRLDELESHYDKQFRVVFHAIRQLMATPTRGREEIGFRSRSAKK